ncbi:MAG: alanine racemase, partial [Erysipelotrichia bacterium]|nr:alanine racemase [Erysipelotrichia bacterium]
MAYITINKKHLYKNLDFFAEMCGVEKIAVALKDNA